MERKRGTTVAVVAALIIAVVSLGIAFAAFSTTLNINGNATVNASSWNIFFTDAANGTDPGTSGRDVVSTAIHESNDQAGISETVTAEATIKTAAFDWSATFVTPGDRVVYDLYVKNTGSYAAKITSINTPTKTCTSGGANETTVCPYIHYGVYTNDTGTTALAENAEIAAGGTAHYYVIAYLDKDMPAASLPSTAVTASWTQISIVFTQK